jgi:hypothetical protein
MDALVMAAPQQTVWLNGIEYVRIYAMADMPEGFYDELWP